MACGLLSILHWLAARLPGANLTQSSWTGLRTTPHCLRPAPGAIAKTPPTPTGAWATLRQMGQMAFTILITSITHCPGGLMDIFVTIPCQVRGKWFLLSVLLKNVWLFGVLFFFFTYCRTQSLRDSLNASIETECKTC